MVSIFSLLSNLHPLRSLAVVLIACLLIGSPPTFAADELEITPPAKPVIVKAGYYLVDINAMEEASETFEADFYFSFRWSDPRLTFAGSDRKRYMEERAAEKLGEIWWPQIEFVNTSEARITNQILEIQPDGSVQYIMGVSAKYREQFDLRRFPFDRQELNVQIQSFAFDKSEVLFQPDTEYSGFSPKAALEGVRVTAVFPSVGETEIHGWNTTFSEFNVHILIERISQFYLWTIFVPVTLVFLMSCSIFLIPIENLQDRVGICLSAILACIATQFAMSFNLPQISYLTRIDSFFATTYCLVALQVITSAVQRRLIRSHPVAVKWIDRGAIAVFPLLFLAAAIYQAL